MDGKVSNPTTIQVEVSKQSLKRNVFYIPAQHIDFFPADSLGARGKRELEMYPECGLPVKFDYGGEHSTCDIAATKSRLRPRDTGPIRKFYEANEAAVGDYVVITRVAPRSFKIELARLNGTAV